MDNLLFILKKFGISTPINKNKLLYAYYQSDRNNNHFESMILLEYMTQFNLS